MMEKDFKDFALLVPDMRKKQKAYFKNRTDHLLQECKALEKEVDLWVWKLIPNGEPRQQCLPVK